MSNFLVVCTDGSPVGPDLFRAGLAATRLLKDQTPSSVLANGVGHAATFARRNGTGSPIAKDPATGSWLLAAGTWFHPEGFSSGAESRLLSRILEAGLPSVLREIDGWFTLIVGDARAGEVLVATDPIGGCYTCVREAEGALAIAGSSAVLAAVGPSTLDPLGCQEFLRTGIVFEGRTLHREVRRLGPATILRVRRGAIRARERYWSVARVPVRSVQAGEAAEALHASLVETARRVTSLHGRPVCDLTGGYDSRAVIAGFAGTGNPFSTTVTGTPASVDVVIAARVARAGGLRHEWIEPRPPRDFSDVERASRLVDGEYDPVEYAQILSVHDRLSARHSVTVNGSNGEIARGLWWRYIEGTLENGRLDGRALSRARLGDAGAQPALFAQDARFDADAHLAGILARAVEPLGDLPTHARTDAVYMDVRLHHWQARIASSTDQIWPCISPFSFRSVLETALSIPAPLRARSAVMRRMLAAYQPRMARVRLSKGYPALPVTWKNLPWFWSTPAHVGRKVWGRVEDRMGIAGRAATGSVLPPRMHLLAEQPVRELLDPGRMSCGSLLDPGRLRSFLADAESRTFVFEAQWNRLLGLELVLRNVRDARARVGRAAEEARMADSSP